MPQNLHQAGTVPHPSNISGRQLFHSCSHIQFYSNLCPGSKGSVYKFPAMELLGSQEHFWSLQEFSMTSYTEIRVLLIKGNQDFALYFQKYFILFLIRAVGFLNAPIISKVLWELVLLTWHSCFLICCFIMISL